MLANDLVYIDRFPHFQQIDHDENSLIMMLINDKVVKLNNIPS